MIIQQQAKEAVRGHEGRIVSEFRGPPNRALSSHKELRFGNKGSLSLQIEGPKSGLWFDHEMQRGGDIIELIKIELRCDDLGAIDWIQKWAGIVASNDRLPISPNYFSGRLDFGPPPKPAPHLNQIVRSAEDRSDYALSFWDEAKPIMGSIGEDYLKSRSISLTGEACDVLRYHPNCPFGRERQPALVAIVKDIITKEPLGIHRTPLTITCGGVVKKASQAMALGPIGGGAIKFVPDDCGIDFFNGELTIGEGIETTLSAMALGFRPAWSVINAGGIRNFPLLPYIRRLTIIVDNDASGTGQIAAAACSAIWVAAGKRVNRVMPSIVGQDLNDVLTARDNPQ